MSGISKTLEETPNVEFDLDEEYEPQGVTFLTSCKESDKDAVMDLVAWIDESLEQMDWESLPLQGRLDKKNVVIKVEIS